jgi:hypothetical protein
MRHRARAVLLRWVRGSFGFIAGLGISIKLKVLTTLSGKLIFAGLIGVGFAWPMIGLTLLVVVVVIGAIVAVSDAAPIDAIPGDCLDCGDCDWKNKRRKRLLAMIAEREAWLARGKGPPPKRRAFA